LENEVSTNATDGSGFVFIYDKLVKDNDIYFPEHERPNANSPVIAKYCINGTGFTLDSVQSETMGSIRAAKEARTLDPQLGKLMLYQLSYCRLLVMLR
jgi:hypothetical protein